MFTFNKYSINASLFIAFQLYPIHKLRYIKFHDLRHTSATLLINHGVHAKIISERLGHANITTTMNIYGHVLAKADKEAANKFDQIITFKSWKEV